METKVEKVSKSNAPKELFRLPAICRAAKIIRSGGIVAFPTETVYGLGASGLNAAACRKIYEAKGRPSDNPLILHVANRAMVDCCAREVPEAAEKLMAAFMPGPLTLILPRKSEIPDVITGGLDTVGVRMPEHFAARALIKAAGVPIAAPSANRSGRPSPTRAVSVLRDMKGRIPMILDGGACRYGIESTIVDVTGDVPIILRPGAITKEEIQELLGACEVDRALGGEGVPKAPGMKYRHYAPKAEMFLLTGSPGKILAAMKRRMEMAQRAGKKVGILASEEIVAALAEKTDAALLKAYGRENDLPAIAANLYELLLAFDAIAADVILAEGTEECGLGLAIMNRMKKASGGRVESLD